MTVPSDKEYDPAAHLSQEDIRIDIPVLHPSSPSPSNSQKLTHFVKELLCTSGHTASVISVAAVLEYLRVRSPSLGPLSDGRYLTKQRFVTASGTPCTKLGLTNQSTVATVSGLVQRKPLPPGVWRTPVLKFLVGGKPSLPEYVQGYSTLLVVP